MKGVWTFAHNADMSKAFHPCECECELSIDVVGQIADRSLYTGTAFLPYEFFRGW